MELRKGLVYFVCKDEKQMHYVFEEILYLLKPKVKDSYRFKYECSISINGYRLLFKTNYTDSCRGYRPEIVYIDRKSDISLEHIHTVVKMKSFLSVRKEPIRFIDFDTEFNYIDLLELIDDEHALENTVDYQKLKRWNRVD